MSAYREGLRRRLNRALNADEQAAVEAAWREASQAAERLVQQYGAKRVILFGSVARRRRLQPDSDIDLAVEGMTGEVFYKIAGDLHTSDGRRIDLVRLDTLGQSFRKVIALEGVLLAHDGE